MVWRPLPNTYCSKQLLPQPPNPKVSCGPKSMACLMLVTVWRLGSQGSGNLFFPILPPFTTCSLTDSRQHRHTLNTHSLMGSEICSSLWDQHNQASKTPRWPHPMSFFTQPHTGETQPQTQSHSSCSVVCHSFQPGSSVLGSFCRITRWVTTLQASIFSHPHKGQFSTEKTI